MNAPARPVRKLGRIWWLVFAVGFVGLLGLVSFFVLYRTFQIPSDSMSPTLLRDEFVLIRMWRLGPPPPLERGDMVLFQAPDDPKTLRFSRVVGLPGDRVEIVDKRLRLNGREVAEPYAVHKDPQLHGSGDGPIALRDNLAPVEVPKGHFFVMGDNRDQSYDSRFFGPVPRDLLRGGKQVIHLP